MFVLLEIRDRAKEIYQKYSAYINVVLKFIFSLVLFLSIRSAVGLDARFASVPVCIGLAIVGAFLPVSLLTLISIVLCSVHLLKISYVCTVVFVFIYLIMWLFFLRHSSKYGYVFLATPILINMGAPYAIPLIFGMTAAPMVAVAIFGGTVMYFILKICMAVSLGDTNINPDEILQLFRYIMNTFIANKEMYSYIVLLVAVTLLVYAIRTRKFDYANVVAVVAGGIVNIIVFIMATMVLEVEISIVGLIIWSILGSLIGFVASGFVRVLDYSKVENVQFEDDEYYYYVKAVPKLKVAASQNKIKNITKLADIDKDEADDNDDEGEFSLDEFDDIPSKEPNKTNSDSSTLYDDEYED